MDIVLEHGSDQHEHQPRRDRDDHDDSPQQGARRIIAIAAGERRRCRARSRRARSRARRRPSRDRRRAREHRRAEHDESRRRARRATATLGSRSTSGRASWTPSHRVEAPQDRGTGACGAAQRAGDLRSARASRAIRDVDFDNAKSSACRARLHLHGPAEAAVPHPELAEHARADRAKRPEVRRRQRRTSGRGSGSRASCRRAAES